MTFQSPDTTDIKCKVGFHKSTSVCIKNMNGNKNKKS